MRWDLSQGEQLPDIVPALAESWEVDKNDDRCKWRFKLRRGVKFHDGSDFNADAVIWNWEKIRNKDAPQYDSKQAVRLPSRITVIKDYRKIDDYTVEFTTTRPSSFVPFQVVYVLYSSPAQWEKLGRDWRAFAAKPVRHRAFKMTRFVPRERAEYEPNPEYWDTQPHPQSRQSDPAPHAGSHDAARGAAHRPSGLDRSATARCHPDCYASPAFRSSCAAIPMSGPTA